jgi:Nif-specific regulatory protein
MPQLILKRPDSKDKIFKLTGAATTIGRRHTSDVFLMDESVSRDHAKIITLKEGGYEIHDVGARHPTTVNGKIVSSHRLRDGDRIGLGDSILIFKSEETPSTAHVEFLATEDMSHETLEVASFDAKKTSVFSVDDLDLQSLQKDHQRLMLLYEVGKAISLHLEDSYHMMDEILSIALRTLDAERGFIALVDENTGDLTCELVRDNTANQEPEKLEVSRTIIHKVLKGGVSVLTANALKDHQFRDVKSVKEYSIRSAACAPLLFRDEVMGVVYLDNRASAGSFSEDDLMFLTALCHQAGIAMGNAWLHRQVVQENIMLAKALKPKFQVLGESEKMKTVFATIKKVAPTELTVLVQGETGTGKELVANAIHSLSPRRDRPFFLDEIGDMSLDMQAKVLRTLEEREFERIGGSKNIKVDVRVIAATNRDLGKYVEAGEFREDLYYRLNVVLLKLPTLREKKKDIIPLAENFMAGRAKKISLGAEKLLLAYDWPGNVRELKNCIERAVVLGQGEVIQPEDLPIHIRKGSKIIPSPLESIENMEQDHIIRVLRYTNWNKSDAAKILGVTRQTLDNKINKYKIKK